MQTTPIFALPYVEPADAIADFPAVSEQLAETLDPILAGLTNEIGYNEIVSNVSVTGTTAGAPTDVVSLPAITYTAVPHLIEFFAPELAGPASSAWAIALWDGATDLGRLGYYAASSAAGSQAVPLKLARRLTPTAGAHTYKVRIWRAAGTGGSIICGGGGPDTFLPAFIRASRV